MSDNCKVTDWNIQQEDDGRISQASYVLENLEATDEISSDYFPESIGPTLVRAINSLKKQMIESNGETASFTMHNVGVFGGDSLAVMVIKRAADSH